MAAPVRTKRSHFGFEEFAYNTGSVTAAGGSDLTSFGYGSGGTFFNSFNSTTLSTSTVLRCRFLNPIQSTDLIVFEMLEPGSNTWISVDMRGPSSDVALNAFYGVSLRSVSSSSTDIDVNFNNSGASASNATSYGGVGQVWSSYSTYKWRLRKTSNPGF